MAVVGGVEAVAAGGGEADSDVNIMTELIIYNQQLPTGKHTFKVSGVNYDVFGPWQVTWDQPAGAQTATEEPAVTQQPASMIITSGKFQADCRQD